MSSNTNFKKAAYFILKLSRSPLLVDRILELAIESGELITDGETPENTMRARLSEDIRNNGNLSTFIRTAPNTFGLREWGNYDEYNARPMVKSYEENIICVHQNEIDRMGRFFGFSKNFEEFFKNIDNKNLRIFNRTDIENNDEYKQLITYVILENIEGNYLTFRRGSYSTANKKLLEGAICIGFGGHVRKEDYISNKGNYHLFDLLGIKFSSLREIEEELGKGIIDIDFIKNSLRIIGLINDDSSPTGLRHLGIVMQAKLPPKFDVENYKHGALSEKSIREIIFRDNINLWENFYQLEFWSQLLCKNFFEQPNNIGFTVITPRRKRILRGPISIVGEIATGKTEVANCLNKLYNIPIVSTRECVANLIEVPDFEGEFRKKFSDKAYIQISTKKGRKKLAANIINEIKEKNNDLVVIDGIRNIEVNEMVKEEFPSYTTIFLDSPRDLSFNLYKKRINEKTNRSVTIDEFRKVRSHSVEKDVALFKNRADIKIYNGGDLENLRSQIAKWLYV